MMMRTAIISALAAWLAAAEDLTSLVPSGVRYAWSQGSLRGAQFAEVGRNDDHHFNAPGNLPKALSSDSTEVDLSKTVVLQGYTQGGYQQGIQPGGYVQEHYGQGNGQFSLLLSVLIPIVVLVCACCCVFQLVKCCCGEVCSG